MDKFVRRILPMILSILGTAGSFVTLIFSRKNKEEDLDLAVERYFKKQIENDPNLDIKEI